MSGSFVPDLSAPADGRPQTAPPGPRVYIETYGCQMNTYDTQVILGNLATAGFAPIDDHLRADLLLVNTCSVREHAEHRVISRLHELLQQRRRAGLRLPLVGVCGCMAERLGAELTRHKLKADLVVGVDRYGELPALATELMMARAPAVGDAAQPAVAIGHDQTVHYVAPPELYPTRNSHLVTIHKGCDYRCSYCIVPYTRGPQSEKSPEVILAEIAAVTARGGSEVTLLGQNVTAYSWRGDLDFAGLLELILRETTPARVRFLTGHPRDMHPHLIDLLGREPRICPWLHVPAQSGSDRVLARMRRLYTRDQYLAMIAYARRTIPDVTFSSDFIVGFPGETDADFEQTLALLRAARFDSVFAFKYSPRPGAPAAELADDVPVAEKQRRLADVLAAQAAVWQEIAAAQVGRTWQAVVEEPARRPAGHWRLRTANNRKVIAALPAAAPGQEVKVRVTGWRHTTFHGEPC